MRWCVKGADGWKSRPMATRSQAIELARDCNSDVTDTTGVPHKVVRLVTKRERVIRAMESVLAEPVGSYSVGYCRATSRWLEALKR